MDALHYTYGEVCSESHAKDALFLDLGPSALTYLGRSRPPLFVHSADLLVSRACRGIDF